MLFFVYESIEECKRCNVDKYFRVWSNAHGSIVVMDKKSNVLFTVNRSERLTGKGATNALTKEFVKMLSRYYGLSK